MRTVRIFVSSPGDALGERKRVGRVVGRLNGAFKDSVRLEALRWEERFYSAHDGFQPQIPRAGECDVVVAILRGRLGSPLPPDFSQSLPPEERLPGGYPSGTAYEILSAIRARREGLRGALPDIYVFRWPNPPQITLDAPDRVEIEAQWAALKRFAEEVFVTPEGHFRGAYQSYASLDDFEAQVEALLRGWLDAHVFGGRAVLWPVATRGSPFRGLEPFGMKHAEVFFGRTREIARAVEALRVASQAGAPFLTVVGPSGAGKSSFVRAGLVPRLTGPGEIEGVATWRVALVRPGESPDGPVAALAACLFAGAAAIPEAEAGRPVALPELTEGPFPTPEALARQLAHADDTAAAPLLAALARVAEGERGRWGADRPEPARLLLIVDQFEEIFSVAITDAQREAFTRLLAALGRSGAVFVVTTLRAEFYEVFLKSPLAVLASDERTLTLKPPGLPEMAEIVREPARAADLAWETDPATGERLDERLLADIDRPDLLPLLQFVLDRLFEGREGGDGQGPARLTFAAYRALGTLDGAIRAEAERAFAELDPAAQGALPRLLRGLVVPAQAAAGEGGAVALKPTPLDAAAPDPAARRLAARLTDARILVSAHGPDGKPLAGLAHQRVIEAWDRARTIVAESAEFRRVREALSVRRRDWERAGRPADLLLARGVLLAQGERLATDYADEIAPEDHAYLAASRRRAERALRRAYAASGLFAVVALAAVGAGLLAYREQQRAERNFTLARETVDQVVADIARGLRNVEGMRVATLKRVLSRVEATMARLSQAAPEDAGLQRSRAVMLTEFGNTYAAGGDDASAEKAYAEALAIRRALLRGDPGNADRQRDLSVGLIKEADIRLRKADLAGARLVYEEVLRLRRALVAGDPGDARRQRDLSVSLGRLSDLMLRTNEVGPALTYAEESGAIMRRLAERDPGDVKLRRDLGVDLNQLADIRVRTGDFPGAAEAYRQALAIMQALAERDPGDVQAQRDVSVVLTRLGDLARTAGSAGAALRAYEEAIGMVRTLAARDPDKAEWQRDLALGLLRLGDLRLRLGDEPAARTAYEEGLGLVRALVGRDPGSVQARLDLALNLARLGALSGPAESRRTLLSEALATVEPLAREGRLSAEQAGWPDAWRRSLEALAR